MDWTQYSGDHPSKAIYARLSSAREMSGSHFQGNNAGDESKENGQNGQGQNGNGNGGAQGHKNFENKILLFLKYYDVYHEYLSIVGSILVSKHGDVSAICTAIRG